MAALFADLPEALASTVEIARALRVPAAHRKADPAALLGRRPRRSTRAPSCARAPRPGWSAASPRTALAPGRTDEEYRERLAFELKVIEGMKYPGYFLIVSDFIQWAKDQGIPVGPGRGSGAGSLVAYALTITDLDPLRFDLLFERFLNPERVSMPDFDIDFCQDRRDEVIRYVQERYGRDQVAQIITFGTLQARGVLRDVGRVLEMPYGQVDKLCKLVPQNPAAPVTLAKAIEGEPQAAGRARQRSDRQARLRHRAQARRALPPRLDARRRHRDRRPAAGGAGAALSRSEIRHAGDPVQHEMGRAGGPGEVRLPRPEDADGAADRGAAAEAARHRARSRGDPARRQENLRACWRAPKRSASSNWKVRACAARCSTCGPTVSRTSSRWSRSIGRARWRTSRPIARASTATEQPEYIHPKLEPILKETYGVIVYQEQVMQAAQILAGYYARRGRPAAPRHGQEDPHGDAGAAQAISSTARPSAASSARRPTRSSICSSASPNTASTRATPPPTRWSPTRPPT